MNRAHQPTTRITFYKAPMPLAPGVYGSPSSATHNYGPPADPYNPHLEPRSVYEHGPGRTRDPETDLSTEDLRLHQIHQEPPVVVGDGVYESRNSRAGQQPRHGTDILWATGYNREMPIIGATEDIAAHVGSHAVIGAQAPPRRGQTYYSARHVQR